MIENLEVEEIIEHLVVLGGILDNDELVASRVGEEVITFEIVLDCVTLTLHNKRINS